MIIKNVCLLLEVLSFVICLHRLYGEKFKLDITVVSLLAVDMIMMQAIDYYRLPSIVSVVMYFIIAVYCGAKFGFNIKELITNMVLCVIIIGGIQMLEMLVGHHLYGMESFSYNNSIIPNSVTLVIVLIILPIFEVQKLSRFSQDNGKIIVVVICTCSAWIWFWILGFKNFNSIELEQEIMLFVSIALVLVLAGQLSKYRIKAKEAEIELKMHEFYSKPFQSLIDNIRLKQHEFDNHINAIYSQHYSCHTYEELVGVQKKYCEQITKNNRFNKLLAQDNLIIRGYLYGRFLEIDKLGIDISYQVSIKNLDIEIPIYKLVEIVGNLMNNAVEALLIDIDRKKMHIVIMEKNGLYLEVRNESQYVAYDILENIFSKGYSKKGKNRGLGLFNVKQICEEYEYKIFCENVDIDGSSWLVFKIYK